MKIKDVKIGMKVKVLGNTYYEYAIDLPQVKRGYGYVIKKYSDRLVVSEKEDVDVGDTFNYCDIEPFKENLKELVFQSHVEVELRGGLNGIVVCNIIHSATKDIVFEIADKSFIDNNLKHKTQKNYDIMKATLNGEVIYKREQEKWSEWKLTKNPRYRTYYRTKGKRVQIKVKGFKTVIGEAKCNPEDDFDLKKGIDIAYNRAIINLYKKKLYELLKQ